MFDFILHIDELVFVFINQTLSASWIDPMMILASSKWIWLPVYAFILFLFYRKFGIKMWIPVLFSLIAFGLSDSISNRVFKQGVKRERPFLNAELHAKLPDGPAHSKYGFVSSHAANMFALAMTLQLMMSFPRKLSWISFALAGLVAYSRVYLGVHYPLDVIFGGILGVLLAGITYRTLGRIPYFRSVLNSYPRTF